MIGEIGKVIVGDNVLEEAILEENINGDGGLTLGWNSVTGGVIPAGTEEQGFVLLAPYVPTRNENGSYRYSVKLSSPIALLGKRYFYKDVLTIGKDGTEETARLYTFSYVGIPATIITALCSAAGMSQEVNGDMPSIVSVSFDGDTIKSAAQKIADACGVCVWYTGGTVHFGSPVGYQSGEYYNRFIVLGGTKNMSRKVSTSEGEEYAAVTQRLTLGAGENSYLDYSNGGPVMEKILVFDDVYPKVRMRIDSVLPPRRCYLLDDKGEKIVADTSKSENDHDRYAQYYKWYIHLSDIEGEGHIDQSDIDIIDGMVLRMQFIPFEEGGESLLAGREFELVRFNENTVESEEDDIDGQYVVPAGYYRIITNADGGALLPTTTSQGIIPRVGDIVNLVNIAVPESCYTTARRRLREAGEAAAAAFMDEQASYTEDGDGAIGETHGRYIVTGVTTNLITGEKKVTYGTFAPKGLLSSMIDKVEGARTTGGGGTSADDSRRVATMSAEQWQALAKAGGRTGLVALNKRLLDDKKTIDALGLNIRQIQGQVDESLNIYYTDTTPLPNTDMPEAAANYPASEWASDEERALHVGDIIYNTSLDPASDGGRAWKWTDSYTWESFTDVDTIAALEKIREVSNTTVKIYVRESLPSPPYKIGDMWLNSVTGELMVCKVSRSVGDTPQPSDWSVFSDDEHFASITQLLSLLAAKWESWDIQGRIRVYMTDDVPEGYDMESPEECNVWYCTDEEGDSSGKAYRLGAEITDGSAQYLGALAALGLAEFSVWDSLSAQAGRYDLHFATSSFVDKFTQEEIRGGLNVWVFRPASNSWEKVQDGTSGLMENYGNHIVSAIFGVEPDGTTNYAAGIFTQDNFSAMIARASDESGDKALAAIATLLEFDKNGNPTGMVKIDASEVDVSLNNIDATGTFSSTDGVIKISNQETHTSSSDTFGINTSDEDGYYEQLRLGIALNETNILNSDLVLGNLYKEYRRDVNLIGAKPISEKEECGLDLIQHVHEIVSDSQSQQTSVVDRYNKTEVKPEHVLSPMFGIITSVSYNSVENRFIISKEDGITGQFETADGKTVTVKGGIITNITNIA